MIDTTLTQIQTTLLTACPNQSAWRSILKRGRSSSSALEKRLDYLVGASWFASHIHIKVHITVAGASVHHFNYLHSSTTCEKICVSNQTRPLSPSGSITFVTFSYEMKTPSLSFPSPLFHLSHKDSVWELLLFSFWSAVARKVEKPSYSQL